MDNNTRAQAKEMLAALIERVMADGKIEPEEREEMQAFFRQAVVTVGDMRDVLARYLRVVQNEVLADGQVTDEERARVRAVVTELKIPPSLWPNEIRAIVS
jgi:uncharacterized tellurite resistance protein B-like protein